MLNEAYDGEPRHPVFLALADTARRTGIPRTLFADLLRAFRMDVEKTRYPSFEALLAYCRFSANPVGRIVLHIFEDAAPEHGALSDRICTGLQLANFWQDISVDRSRGRLYLPLDDLERFGYTEEELARGEVTGGFLRLMKHEVDRAREFLLDGSPLIGRTVRTLRFELALTVRGGLAILRSIEKRHYDTLRARPVLSGVNKARILLAAYRDARG